ncbi:MAG: hypothetical protein K1X74_02110 [Pirellulales bacterium]|nr:hypothetical protein [Pirellulales bacterium]
MHRPLGLALSLAIVGAATWPATADDCPFAAHNAYPWRLYPKGRFEAALQAKLKHVELDISYDPDRNAVVVTHDAKPVGNEPLLAGMFQQLIEGFSAAGESGQTIILDFKISSPEIVAGVAALLPPHAAVLSKLAKQPGAAFREGPITVCFTGNTAAHRLYEASINPGGDYLAFGDGGAGGWLENAAEHVLPEPAGFVRFLTYEQSVFLDAPRARAPEHLSVERMKAVIEAANARGYRVRIYTLNPPRKDGQLDRQGWEKCVAAGVHMIATDAYDDARQWWESRRANPQ